MRKVEKKKPKFDILFLEAFPKSKFAYLCVKVYLIFEVGLYLATLDPERLTHIVDSGASYLLAMNFVAFAKAGEYTPLCSLSWGQLSRVRVGGRLGKCVAVLSEIKDN